VITSNFETGLSKKYETSAQSSASPAPQLSELLRFGCADAQSRPINLFDLWLAAHQQLPQRMLLLPVKVDMTSNFSNMLTLGDSLEASPAS